MNSAPSPLVGRLILLVLTLILGCLVVLVVRSFQNQPTTEITAVAEAEAFAAEPAEPIVAVANAPLPLPRPPARNASANAARGVPPPPVEDEAFAETPLPGHADASQSERALPVSSTRLNDGSTSGLGADGGAFPNATAYIQGIVTLSGTPPPEIPIEMDPACARLQTRPRTTRHFVVGPDQGLANVFVYLKSAVPGRYVPTGPPPLLDQVECFFEPYVLGVMAGQTFHMRNSDPVLHNIHATPKANREFNFAQTQRGQVNTRSFDTPELFVRLKCDVHPWMFAYVCVVPHPFHAVTDTNGYFALPRGFPPGEYTVAAHHLRAGEVTQTISLKAGEQRTLRLQLAVPAGPRTVAR
jgi:hypothetical protein